MQSTLAMNEHIILVYDVWLFNIHSRFFTMTITFGLLYWLFTSKGGNRTTTLLSFQRTKVMLEDKSVPTSDDRYFYFFIFTITRNEAFYIWFPLTVSVAATPIALKVPQQSWACEIIVHDNVIIGGLHHKFSDEVCNH